MRTIRRYISLGLLLSVFTVSVPAQTSRTNVLFLVVDDLNDYVPLLRKYPGLKTPNLDKFAKTSINFTRSYCAAPVCNPSRVAFLSGLAPNRTGVYDNENNIQDSKQIDGSRLLPEHFQANGYITITRGKVFHTMPKAERYHAMWNDEGGKGDYGPYPTESNVPKSIRRPRNFNYQEWQGPDSDHPDNVTVDFAIDRLAKNYDKPFFMACGLYKPHNPWTAPQRFFDMYPLEDMQLPKVLESEWDDLPAIAKRWAANPVDYKALKQSGQWKALVRSYLACISFMDWNLGRIFEALDKSRYGNNTIVCLVADNGFHLGEKQHFAKYALWEQTTHILTMWRVPRLTDKGGVCDRTVNLLDIYPTLTELCGLNKPPQKLDGRSLVTLLKNPAAAWPYPSVSIYRRGNASVRTPEYRYIRYADGEEELYDEEKDPNEWKNLAKDPEMKALLISFRKKAEMEYAPPVTVDNGIEPEIK